MERTPTRHSAVLPALAAALVSFSPIAAVASVCAHEPVLTLLATNTRNDESLFALPSGDGSLNRLIVLEGRSERARLFADSSPGARSGGSHGAGPFLSTTRCGKDCFQPIQWRPDGWAGLGGPVSFSDASTVHMTYDGEGAPWLLFHRLPELPGVTEVTAFRFTEDRWSPRGRLLVQAIGSPGVTADPTRRDAVLSGSGRFQAEAEPSYWLPALPALGDSAAGQVRALTEAAIFLTSDSRLFLGSRDGTVWLRDTWTPWPNRKGPVEIWQAGEDYWLDLPATAPAGSLPALWFDERREESPRLHLAAWEPGKGWKPVATIELTGAAGPRVEHVLTMPTGKWLLLGGCRSTAAGSVIDALIVDPGAAGSPRAKEIPLEAAPTDRRP
jgi:hypothetical protein